MTSSEDVAIKIGHILQSVHVKKCTVREAEVQIAALMNVPVARIGVTLDEKGVYLHEVEEGQASHD